MSARRLFAPLALALAAGAALARPAHAADSVVVQVAGQLAARAGQTITVPVTVDMRGAPGRTLGGYTLALNFDTAAFYYYGDSAGSFAAPLVNTDSAGKGQLRFTAIMPAGATGLITLFSVQLYVRTDTIVSAITLTPTQLTAASGSLVPFEDLLPITKVVNGTFCRALGMWGDVDGDGQANSKDALVALSEVVGLPVDTTIITPGLADVDGDGKVTSLDALIILSNAVGLPVSGFRIGQVAAGACATGNATTLAILPDSLELSAGQIGPVLVRATDATGRVVPIPNLTWSSSNTAVAAFVEGGGSVGAPPAGRLGGMQALYLGAGIQARAAGTAVITATMAPGVTAQLKVVVLAHRGTWYVDVRRARNAPTQTGSQLYPFEFIGDAVDAALARDGDSVLVAGGEYDEEVSSQMSIVLLGDSADQPVIDMRGAPYYGVYNTAVSLGSSTGAAEMAHFVVRGGGVFLQAHDMFVHDVVVQLLGGQTAGLELSSPGASLGAVPGNVRVDRVSTDGALYQGILVDDADSVAITNSVVARDSGYANTCSMYPGAYAGIGVSSTSAALIQGNTVTDAACVGIEAYQTAGRVRITGNTILRPSGVGILVDAPVALTDHNVVRSVAVTTGAQYQNAYGIYFDTYNPVDSAISVHDSVVGVHGYYSHAGVYVAGATASVVDSLVADSIGDPGTSYYGNGVTAFGARIGVAHSRLTRLVGSGIQAGTSGFEFTSQRNFIADAAGGGISFTASCDCSAMPDTAISDGDSILTVGGHAIDFAYANAALVRNAVIDSAASYGVYLYGYTGAPAGTVLNSKISRTNTGISSAYLGSLQVSGDSLLNNGTGAYVQQTGDTVRVNGTVVSGGSSGLVFWYNPVVVDSSAMINTLEGFYLDGGHGGFISRSRFQADSVGVLMGYSPRSLTVSGSNFQGNQVAVDNEENATDTVLVNAAGNFWGIGNGPTCDSVAYGGCPGNGTTTGDSVKSYLGTPLRIDYSGWLVSPAVPTAAPRVFATTTVRRAGQSITQAPSRTPRLLTRRALLTAPPAATTTVPAAPRARHVFPPAWQKGRARRAAAAR